MKKLLDDRKTSPTQPGDENLLEWIISHSDDEEAQIADIILFSMAGQYATGYCKQSCRMKSFFFFFFFFFFV